ncbi:MAG: Holliday junction DNA helicase RuvB [Ignavibacteria bacterium GWB2_36_8]|nr:MAG: Holliday junction DNA helicase RuvB [Ignavibacteria bacterium GWB2_36_8]
MAKPGALSGEINVEEKQYEQTLRPMVLKEFAGQTKITDNLNVFISAAGKRNDALDHTLLTGPPGLGKTTLAYIIANEMGVKLKITSGPVLEKAGDLAGILTNLEEKSVLFIDEIHRLSPVIEEYLYSAMEDYKLDIMIDSGPNARSVQISLPKYTLIGATTREGMLTSPLRDRFGIKFRLDYYDSQTLETIVTRSSRILKIKIKEDAAFEIAKRSRGTPRIANRLLRRTRDFADFEDKKTIDIEVSRKALKALDVDEFGLDEMDKDIILTIIEKFAGGPVGLGTLAVAVNEDPGTIEEVYEPFLIQQGFIHRTPRGREATDLAYRRFGKSRFKSKTDSLFD